MENKEIAKIEEIVTLKEGRIMELSVLYNSLVAKDQDSWGGMLNTQKFYKRKKTINNIRKYIVQKAIKFVSDNFNYKKFNVSVRRTGSDKLFDVQRKINQGCQLVITR